MARFVSSLAILLLTLCLLFLHVGCTNRKGSGAKTKEDKSRKLSQYLIIQHQADQLRGVYGLFGDEVSSVDDMKIAFSNSTDGGEIEDLSAVSSSGWLQMWTVVGNGNSKKLVSPLFHLNGISYLYEIYKSDDNICKMELKKMNPRASQ